MHQLTTLEIDANELEIFRFNTILHHMEPKTCRHVIYIELSHREHEPCVLDFARGLCHCEQPSMLILRIASMNGENLKPLLVASDMTLVLSDC